MNKVAFIRNNQVVSIYWVGDIHGISKANFRTDWQARIPCSTEVAVGWFYNPDTNELTSP